MAIAIAMHCGAYKNLDLYLCWLEIVFFILAMNIGRNSQTKHMCEKKAVGVFFCYSFFWACF